MGIDTYLETYSPRSYPPSTTADPNPRKHIWMSPSWKRLHAPNYRTLAGPHGVPPFEVMGNTQMAVAAYVGEVIETTAAEAA